MKIGVIGAMDCEIREFCKDFDAVSTGIDGIYKGHYAGHEIYVCLCGIGKVNAAVCTQRLCDVEGVDCIINSGVAGSVSKKLKICDVAVSESLTYHDFEPIDILDRNSPFTSVFKADEKLVGLAKSACERLAEQKEGFGYASGLIISGDKFVSGTNDVQKLNEKFGALCTEMEGAAIAHAALLNKKPFVVIRAISDNADDDADMSFDAMAEIAAKQAGFIVTDMIENIGK